jgi:hypothetical protein
LIGRWQPAVGDPTVWGWITVAGYALACTACAAAAFRLRRQRAGDAWAWLGLAGLMLVLGLNKQLDLQSLLTQWGKDLAHQQGWYEQRRLVQAAFVAGLGLAMLAGLAVVGWAARRSFDRWCALALVGVVMLAGFVLMRAAAFNKVTALTASQPLGVSVNHLLENIPILLIILAAWGRSRSAARRFEPHAAPDRQPTP